jgi:hypothetical protein
MSEAKVQILLRRAGQVDDAGLAAAVLNNAVVGLFVE